MSRQSRMEGHDGEPDGRGAPTRQEQPDARAPPDGPAEEHEDHDLGHDADGPEIADRRIREAERAPVDAARRR